MKPEINLAAPNQQKRGFILRPSDTPAVPPRRVAHIFRSYDIEVGTAKNGTNRQRKPGYRWVPGWSEALPDGAMSQPYRLRDLQEWAAGEGVTLKRHRLEKDARAALKA